MISTKTRTIIKECMKFQGYYKEVEHRHPSGVPYQEHVLIPPYTLIFVALDICCHCYISNHALDICCT